MLHSIRPVRYRVLSLSDESVGRYAVRCAACQAYCIAEKREEIGSSSHEPRYTHQTSTGTSFIFPIFYLIFPDFFHKLTLSDPSDQTFENILLIFKVHFGGHGYSHIANNVVPTMINKGFTVDEIEFITIENPKRWLTRK